jgi:hypothetical protein
MVEDTLRPLRRSDPGIVRVMVSDTSDQRDHYCGRDRQCGEPRLSSAYLRKVGDKTDPTICTLRRFKAFPSLVRPGLATVPALVVHF